MIVYVNDTTIIRKTQIIEVIKENFSKMDLQFILNIAAYITSVTMLINGSTIHSIICLLVNNLINPCVYDHLVIYEVSMVSCNIVVDIHLKLQMLKANIFSFIGLKLCSWEILCNCH
jgi:hypothetical protein